MTILHLIKNHKSKRANNNYAFLCPFHSEQTPSFVINGNTNSYFCFSCGKEGQTNNTERYFTLTY